MTNTDSEIRSLEGHIAAMKDEYARMIQSSLQAFPRAIRGCTFCRGRFCPSGHSVSTAAILLLAPQRTGGTDPGSQLELRKPVVLGSQTAELEGPGRCASERNRLADDRSQRQAWWNPQGEESRLRAQVQQAEAEKKRLNDAIRAIIEAELKAERESSAGEFALPRKEKSPPPPLNATEPPCLGPSCGESYGEIRTAAARACPELPSTTTASIFPPKREFSPFGLRWHGLQHVEILVQAGP